MQHPWLKSDESAVTDLKANAELLVNQQQHHTYVEFMDGCARAYSKNLCQSSEEDRVAMNAQQPLWQRNYTSSGFVKVLAPPQSFQALLNFWNTHYSQDEHNNCLVDEAWPNGNIYTNHWKVPTKALLVDSANPDRPKLDVRVRRQLVQEVQTVLEDWSGVPLVATTVYGIRAYSRGSILVPHVDRLPLVLSAIINVAQEGMEHDWPLELVRHDGIAVNITMKPGDMVLYESHAILHGRPFPLQGDIYANLFLHFEPIGFTTEAENGNLHGRREKHTRTARENFNSAFLRSQQTAENSDRSASKSQLTYFSSEKKARDLPFYMKEGTVEADRWRQNFVFHRRDVEADHAAARKKSATKRKEHPATNSVHRIAALGNIARMRQLAAEDPDAMQRADSNGWKPIHG